MSRSHGRTAVARGSSATTMAQFLIEGQHRLQGEVTASGMKSAATALIAATLVTTEECRISNVPRIADVFNMVKILQSMGSQIDWEDDHTLTIRNDSLDPEALDQTAITKLRSSVLLLGPLAARFPRFSIARPGGDTIGNRPLDTHFEALTGLGVQFQDNKDRVDVSREALRGTKVVLPEFSVTATENLMMAATIADGTTTIHTAATEPHVQNLGKFLCELGAKIEGIGTHAITIHGVPKLHGATIRVIPDQIEIGTWAIAAAVTRSELVIRDVVPDHLDMVLLKLQHAGVRATLKGTLLHVKAARKLKAFRLQSLPYPGFPTDLQAPFAVLATQAEGTSLIHDPMYEGRMGHIKELVSMGANAIVCDPHRVLITGPTPLYGKECTSYDIRNGATLILAALVAQGTTVLRGAEVVDRGYEKIEEKLTAIGAHITRQE